MSSKREEGEPRKKTQVKEVSGEGGEAPLVGGPQSSPASVQGSQHVGCIHLCSHGGTTS